MVAKRERGWAGEWEGSAEERGKQKENSSKLGLHFTYIWTKVRFMKNMTEYYRSTEYQSYEFS